MHFCWRLRVAETSLEASDDRECSGTPRDLCESVELPIKSASDWKRTVVTSRERNANRLPCVGRRLLVYLKSYRNAVPVPRHWCHKRKYLQGKRGVEKKPWQLPEFIAQTGIEKIRRAVEEESAMKKTKQKSRERVAPKMGRMDVDYQVLHDAFFKWQSKPPLSGLGRRRRVCLLLGFWREVVRVWVVQDDLSRESVVLEHALLV